MAPMTRARGTPTEDPLDPKSRTPNDLVAEYYEQRASAGLIITEATSVSEEGYGWLNSPEIRTPEQIAGWKNVTDKVHAKGGHIYIQLWHMGRSGHSSFNPKTNRIVSASNIPMPVDIKTKDSKFQSSDPETPVPLTIEEIKQVVQDFVHGAKNAKEAGFDGIELYSNSGYLIDQFLQSVPNKRTNEYGGSFENRIRSLKDIVEAIIESQAFPSNRIGFRIAPNGAYGGMGSLDNPEMFKFVAKEMNQYGLACMHVMDGLTFGFHNLCPPLTVGELRKHFDGPIMSNAGLTRDVAEGMIRSGASDLAAFGRLYISNPDLVERFANDWPVVESAPHEVWWQHIGAKGYTDYPAFKPITVTS
jgi:N-ethylmaleimide reductase